MDANLLWTPTYSNKILRILIWKSVLQVAVGMPKLLHKQNPLPPPATLETKEKADTQSTEAKEKAVAQAQETQQLQSSDPNIGQTINVVA